MRSVVWAVITGLVVASFFVSNYAAGWLLCATLAVGFFAAMNGVFGR